MANFGAGLELALINHSLRGIQYSSPATVYLALCNCIASDGASIWEVPVSSGYSRKPITWALSGPATAQNNAAIFFSAATTPYGIINALAIYDTIAGGNQLYWMPATSVQTISTGNAWVAPVGGLTIQLLSGFSRQIADLILGMTLMGTPAWTPSSTLYIALLTTVAAQGDTVIEFPVDNNNYSRQIVIYGSPTLVGAVANVSPGEWTTYNSNQILFGPASTLWGAVGYLGVYDSVNLGRILYTTSLSSVMTFGTNSAYLIPPNVLSIQLL